MRGLSNQPFQSSLLMQEQMTKIQLHALKVQCVAPVTFSLLDRKYKLCIVTPN